MHKLLNNFLILFAISLAAAWMPAAVQAQAFSFSVGSGHGHHGHHYHGHHHGCWGPHWCSPAFGFAYAPAPVYRERVIYVEPPRTTVIVPSATTAVTTAPAPLANSLPADSSSGGITIRNASGVRLPVAFLVDGQDAELADGQSRVFSGTRHTIQYDRGGRFGGTQQSLASGNYDFRITPSGWDLVRQPDAPATSTAVRANSLPVQR
jgi:hypothetical protein